MKHKSHRDMMPESVRCDFCSGPSFRPQAWNQRTCHRCAADGAPDQSKTAWSPYQRLAAAYARLKGRRTALSGAAAGAAAGKRVGSLTNANAALLRHRSPS